MVVPAEDNEGVPVPLRHGDRIMVEILPDQTAEEPQAGKVIAGTVTGQNIIQEHRVPTDVLFNFVYMGHSLIVIPSELNWKYIWME